MSERVGGLKIQTFIMRYILTLEPLSTGDSPVFIVCYRTISLVYSLFQYIIGDGILLSWKVPASLSTNVVSRY